MVGSQPLSNQYLEGHRHRIITNISSYVSECKIEHYLFVIVPQFAIFGK